MAEVYRTPVRTILVPHLVLLHIVISNPSCVILILSERGTKMKKVFKVEIRGKRSVYYFNTKQEAEDYAIVSTAFSGGAYRITPVFVKNDVLVTSE